MVNYGLFDAWMIASLESYDQKLNWNTGVLVKGSITEDSWALEETMGDIISLSGDA